MATSDRLIHAVFENQEGLVHSLDRLAELGLDSSHLEVRSVVPLEKDSSLPGTGVRSRVPLATITGGLLGGLTAFLIASLSAKAYPLVTGGMPIVAIPPVGIITYEGIALGAILATVAAVLLEGRLLRSSPKPGPFDHHLAEGKILLSISCQPDLPRADLENALARAAEWQEA